MTGPSLEDFLKTYPPEIGKLAVETRSLILRVVPDAFEIVDPPSKIIAYGFGQKYADLICAIAPYPKHINLIFSKGAELPDPAHRLTGTGKRARHIKIQSLADIEDPTTQNLLEEAVQKMKR
jgi:hypothetical protein